MYVRRYEVSRSIRLFDKANIYAMMYNDDITEVRLLLNSAKCYRRLSWLDKAIQYADLCILKAESIAQIGKLISANIIKINCYKDNKEYDIAIKLSEELINSISDKKNLMIGNICNNLGGLYLLNGDIENSLKNFDKSIEFRTRKDPERLSHTIIDKAQLYVAKKKYHQAVELLQVGCEMALKYNDYDYALRGYRELINVYEVIESFENIEEIYIKIINLVKERNLNELNKVYLELSEYYIDQGKLDKADEFMKLSIGHT
jgi:tetratricopeptide (TPR) repeat protein